MADISRRSFLEHSLAVAAAGLAAANTAEAADKHDKHATTRPTTRPTSGPTTSASSADRIGIAVIGVRGRGLSHLDAYATRDDVDVIAVCDIDESVIPKAQSILEEKGKFKPRAVQDLRKLMEDKEIQAVSIATPNHWHSLASIWAMQAGKDVYVEKPVSHNISEGRRMVQASEKYHRICQAGTQSRSQRACRDAMEYIRGGHLGKVILSRGLCYKRRESIGHASDAPVPKGVDYDIWLGPAASRPFNPNRFHYNWHWNWDYGNGDIGNQGIHQMDIARWALGKNTHPTAVQSLGGRFGYDDDGQTPNTQLAFFDYGDARLMFEVRGLKTSPHMGVNVGNIVYGTEGFIAFTGDYETAIAFDNDGKKVKTFKGGGDHFGNFLNAVRSRKRADLHADILEGYLSTALCHMANISYRLGVEQPFSARSTAFGSDVDAYETYGRFLQHLADNGFKGNEKDAKETPLKLQEMNYQLGPRLTFDPAAENFGANEKANTMLTREYREPFVVPAKA